MRERERPRTSPGNNGGGGFFPPPDGDTATVTHGPYAESLSVAGLTVGEIRRRFRDRFDIGPLTEAVVDGSAVDNETIVRAGQTLSFLTRQGEKGRR